MVTSGVIWGAVGQSRDSSGSTEGRARLLGLGRRARAGRVKKPNILVPSCGNRAECYDRAAPTGPVDLSRRSRSAFPDCAQSGRIGASGGTGWVGVRPGAALF